MIPSEPPEPESQIQAACAAFRLCEFLNWNSWLKYNLENLDCQDYFYRFSLFCVD
nr:MAG TPA: hypothetical protein [Caudoviricetes sp.]